MACFSSWLSANPVTDSRTQANILAQFQTFQQYIKTRNIKALNQMIPPETYLNGYMLGGDKGAQVCNDISQTKQVTEALVIKCSGNILDTLSPLLLVKTDATNRKIIKVLQASKQQFCKQTFTGRFNSQNRQDMATYGKTPGLIIDVISEVNPNNPESDEDSCAGETHYFFSYKNQRLILSSLQSLP